MYLGGRWWVGLVHGGCGALAVGCGMQGQWVGVACVGDGWVCHI